jgi:hypothetical protein
MVALTSMQQRTAVPARSCRNTSTTVFGCRSRAPAVRVTATAAPEAPAQPANVKYERPDTAGRFGKFGGKYVPETRECCQQQQSDLPVQLLSSAQFAS